MKKTVVIVLIMICILGSTSTFAFAQSIIDLTGTWKGPADTPDGSDTITFEIAVDSGKVTGRLTDEFGYFTNTLIKEGKLAGYKISFRSVVATPDGDMIVTMKGTVKGDTITGYWEVIDSGDTGKWKAIKQDKKNLN